MEDNFRSTFQLGTILINSFCALSLHQIVCTNSRIELWQPFNLFDLLQLCLLIICREFVSNEDCWDSFWKFANWIVFTCVCTFLEQLKYSHDFLLSNKSQFNNKGKWILNNFVLFTDDAMRKQNWKVCLICIPLNSYFIRGRQRFVCRRFNMIHFKPGKQLLWM